MDLATVDLAWDIGGAKDVNNLVSLNFILPISNEKLSCPITGSDYTIFMKAKN